MAKFGPAFEKMILDEGGYSLHEVEGDNGGMTYAGIARKFHPHWEGWRILDDKDYENESLTDLVQSFYKEHYWDKIRGDDIKDQKIAGSIFNFAVNSGIRVTSKMVQLMISTTPDGRFGDKSVKALNEASFTDDDDVFFNLVFFVMKVKRYAEICNKNRSQSKFLLGWLNRTIRRL